MAILLLIEHKWLNTVVTWQAQYGKRHVEV